MVKSDGCKTVSFINDSFMCSLDVICKSLGSHSKWKVYSTNYLIKSPYVSLKIWVNPNTEAVGTLTVTGCAHSRCSLSLCCGTIIRERPAHDGAGAGAGGSAIASALASCLCSRADIRAESCFCRVSSVWFSVGWHYSAMYLFQKSIQSSSRAPPCKGCKPVAPGAY